MVNYDNKNNMLEMGDQQYIQSWIIFTNQFTKNREEYHESSRYLDNPSTANSSQGQKTRILSV